MEQESLYFIGPLNMDRQAKEAKTVLGTMLSLTGKEFDALDILAAQEGKPVPFEQLCAVLDTNKENTNMGLDHLIKQVGEAGEGFMWIENHPDTGCTFHTRWGHNWKTYTKPATFTHIVKMPITGPRTWHIKAVKTLFSGAAIIAASVALFIMLIQGRPEQDLYIIIDEPVPLAALPGMEIVTDFACEFNLTTGYDESIINIKATIK